ncbi:agip105 [Agrotis ipsilon multiple nucleopolyhedrovirus]|uniref:Desmoplakin n=1 Tax=Agrotis ipsilon multiple nucleopolyhedrovirus TaxID=208013 RepID=B6D619_9ABAC|nr:agip105 [Agrotis ipsilon multiple nucleopolyhedrovirus]ACI28806.1 desmoplakin [Agrotis ipsilon multiple nucleopolyhedrovirus]
MSNRYRSTPKYKNTDVSASTVQNLLQTINNMSQRCKGLANTDDIVQRVRAIILMHRPHLASRMDLQLPELAMEAFMPNSSNASQITHNFNYKYDYNTNMPYNPFMQQQQTSPPLPQTNPSATPLQSFTFNTAPASGGVAAENIIPASSTSSAPPETRVITAPLSIESEDLSNLSVLYANAQRLPSVASYKQLLRQMIFIVRKYIRYEQIIVSLELLEAFDKLQTTNDLVELLQCIERETRWSIPNGSNVCRLISMLVTAYCRVVGLVTNREFSISSIKTEERLRVSVIEVEQAISDLINRPALSAPPAPPPPPPPETDQRLVTAEQINALNATLQQSNDQLIRAQTTVATLQQQLATVQNQNMTIANDLQQANDQLARAQTTITTQRQQLDVAQSQNLILNNAFSRLQTFFAESSGTAAAAAVIRGNEMETSAVDTSSIEDLVTRLITNYTQLQSQQAQLQSQQAQLQSQQAQNASVLSQQSSEYAALNQRYLDSESALAAMQLKLSSFEDTQSQLRAAQERNQQLQQQVTLHGEEYKKLRDEYSVLWKEARKPTHKVRGVPRRSELSRVNKSTAKLVQNQEVLIKERRKMGNVIKELRERQKENVEQYEKLVRQMRIDLQESRSRIDIMASNQAALSTTDLKLLNTKSNQALVDQVSALRAENESVREMCNRELARESTDLRERLTDSKNAIDSRIDKLMNQIDPLTARIEQTTSDIQQFEVRYEQLARSSTQRK